MGQTNTVQFPFAGGVDEKTAKQYLNPQQNLFSITNGNFTKIGAINHRLGMKYLSNTLIPGSSQPAITSGVRSIGWTRSDLTLVSNDSLYMYSNAENGPTGVARVPAVPAIRRPLVSAGAFSAPVVSDFPFNGRTLRMAVYADGNLNLQVTVFDADAGDLILEQTELYAAAANHIVFPTQIMYLPNAPAGQQVVLVITDFDAIGGTAIVYGRYFDPATNTFSLLTSLVTGVGETCVDAVPFVGDPNGGWLLLYASSTTVLTVKYFHGSNWAVGTSFNLPAISTAGYTLYFPHFICGTYGASEHVWIVYDAWDGSSHYEYHIIQYSGDGLFTLEHGPVQPIASGGTIFYDLTGVVRVANNRVNFNMWAPQNPGGGQGLDAPQGLWFTYDDTLTLVAQGKTPLGYYPQARPFVVNNKVYQACYLLMYLQGGVETSDVHSEQITVYLLEYQDVLNTYTVPNALPVATIAPRQVEASYVLSFLLFQEGHLNLMSQYLPTATRFGFGFSVHGTDVAGLSGAQAQPWIADFFFDQAHRQNLYQCNELGTELQISGGVPFVCDSNTCFEDSFFYFPEFAYVDVSSSGSLGGTYSWAIVYTYIDGAGLIHRSAPYVTNPVTISAKEGKVQIPAMSATWRDLANPGQVYAEVYRTLNAGSTYYYVSRIQVSNTNAVYVVYTDNFADSTLASASLIYTTGGVLDNVNAPSAPFQITHVGRKATVDDTLQNVWFTNQFVPGEAVGYNEAYIVPFPEGGDITALGSLDSNFIAFKNSSIWVMTGDGPSITGQNSDWTVPRKIASDVGCISWQSVVLTPVGIMFQASTGIYLLGRDLQVTFIGKNVVDTLNAFPTITSATLVPGSTHVRFTCSNGSTSVTIVYDYLVQQWTKHSYSQITAPIASACLTFEAPQKFTIFTTDGKIWQEHLASDSNAYFDADSSGTDHFVPLSITSADIRISGALQGYQRARRVQFYGDQEDDCGFQIQIAVNGQPAIVQTGTWTSYELAGLPIPGQVEMHVGAQYNKQEMLQVVLTDTAGAAMLNGQGMTFVGLAIEFESLGDRYRLIAAGGRR